MDNIKKNNRKINSILLENINKAIKEKGFSVKEVAERLDLDYSMVWRVLHGQRRLKPEYIAEIAHMTCRTPNDFFFAQD